MATEYEITAMQDQARALQSMANSMRDLVEAQEMTSHQINRQNAILATVAWEINTLGHIMMAPEGGSPNAEAEEEIILRCSHMLDAMFRETPVDFGYGDS